uniref:Photosynthesis system II assembly factor Ycf48/Hcf136-like domain-containing protein n=1 Tax=candidate division WOR-3 bacterium TaxID=2052148 RepID=A0A7C4TBR2_UNCW3
MFFFIDSLRGWIAGQYDFYGLDSSILHTLDGRNWIELQSPINANLNGIFFVDSFNGWIVSNVPFSEVTDSIIAHTTDGGMTWFKQRSSEIVNLNGIFFASLNRGWAVGNSGKIIATVTGGDLWITQNSGITVNLNDIYFTDLLNGWAVGDSGKIIHTTDGGISWSCQQTGTDANLNGLFFYNPSTGWAVGSEGTILATTNGGGNWVVQNSGVDIHLNGVFFVDTNKGWAVGDSGKIIHTTNGGNLWSIQPSGTTVCLYDCLFNSEHNGWAVGKSGTILFYEDIPPNPPALIEPLDSSIINNPAPTFIWHKVWDNSGINKYYIQIDTSLGFGVPLVNDSTIDTTYFLSGNLTNGRFYWRVCAKDSANNSGNWSSVWTFFVDTIRPYVVGMVPVQGDTGVLLDANISATFSELMDSTTMVSGNFSVVGSVSGVHSFGLSYSNLDSTVYLDPVLDFAYGETVVVTIKKDVCDLAGNTMADDKVWEFYIQHQQDTAGPMTSQLVVSPNPTNGATEIVIKSFVSDSLLGNSIVRGAELFIDSIGPDSTGIMMEPLDGNYDEIAEGVIDTIEISSWQYGTSRWIFVHGIDDFGNWGEFDSVLILVTPPPPDTVPPSFNITISPKDVYIGDTITINAIPSEAICPDSAVICSVTARDSTVFTLILLESESGYSGKMNTAGFVSGDCQVKVSGYDLARNLGSSTIKFKIVPRPGEFLPEKMVYAWPNPARGNNINS